MELMVKQGYILVQPVDASSYELQSGFRAGRVVGGAQQDLDTIVFFSEYVSFNTSYDLVAVEDVLAWLKKEEPAANVSENNSAQ